MDEFDNKRKMVQQLMGMLKKSAANEVGGYSEKKQVTHTPLPKDAPADKPHVKESYKAGSKPAMAPKAMEGTTMGNDVATPMHEGGMVDLSKPHADVMQPASDTHMAEGGAVDADEEALKNLPGPVEDEGAEKDAAQSLHNENNMDEDEDNNSSSFEAFFHRKKKK